VGDYIVEMEKVKEICFLEIITFNSVPIKKKNGFILSSNSVQFPGSVEFPEGRIEFSVVYEETISWITARYRRNDLITYLSCQFYSLHLDALIFTDSTETCEYYVVFIYSLRHS
ncbi:MAG: hypothetical protein QW292_05840, partial [Candidatus Parvarchaeota archaeon]